MKHRLLVFNKGGVYGAEWVSPNSISTPLLPLEEDWEFMKCCKTAIVKEANATNKEKRFCSGSESSRPCTPTKSGTRGACSQIGSSKTKQCDL